MAKKSWTDSLSMSGQEFSDLLSKINEERHNLRLSDPLSQEKRLAECLLEDFQAMVMFCGNDGANMNREKYQNYMLQVLKTSFKNGSRFADKVQHECMRDIVAKGGYDSPAISESLSAITILLRRDERASYHRDSEKSKQVHLGFYKDEILSNISEQDRDKYNINYEKLKLGIYKEYIEAAKYAFDRGLSAMTIKGN